MLYSSLSLSFDLVERMLHKLFQCPAAFGIPTQFIVHFFFYFARLSNASASYCLFGMELEAKNPHSEKLLTTTTMSATALNQTDFRLKIYLNEFHATKLYQFDAHAIGAKYKR